MSRVLWFGANINSLLDSADVVLTYAPSVSCNSPVEELPPHTPKSSSFAGGLQHRPPEMQQVSNDKSGVRVAHIPLLLSMLLHIRFAGCVTAQVHRATPYLHPAGRRSMRR